MRKSLPHPSKRFPPHQHPEPYDFPLRNWQFADPEPEPLDAQLDDLEQRVFLREQA